MNRTENTGKRRKCWFNQNFSFSNSVLKIFFTLLPLNLKGLFGTGSTIIILDNYPTKYKYLMYYKAQLLQIVSETLATHCVVARIFCMPSC